MRLALLLTLFWCAAVDAAEFRLVCRHGTPIADRTRGWSGHVDRVSWVDDDHVVFAANGSVACLDVATRQIDWSLAGIREIDSWAISTGTKRLVFSERSQGLESLGIAKAIAVVDCTSGKRLSQLSRESLAKLLGLDFVIPGQLAIFPADGRLLVCEYARSYGRNACLLDETGTKLDSKIEIDASPREISLSADGRFLSVAADEALCVRDLKERREIFFRGKRVLHDPESISLAIDAPFYSHIRSDGRDVIYTQDNSWATGRVFVHDLARKSTKSFDARNGHIEMGVNFSARRIVLTGTQAGLTLLDFEGKEIAHLNKASLQRNCDVEFSPSGKRVAVGSWDNALYVYEIVE